MAKNNVSNGDTAAFAEVIQKTIKQKLGVIRNVTLRKLVIVFRMWKEHTTEAGGLASVFGDLSAPPTEFIMKVLNCSRRSAHDYRVAIQFLKEEDKIMAFLKFKEVS